MKRKIGLALGTLALIATPVLAAGLWANYPLVGSASFCSSTNTAGVPGTAAVCTVTTPAGPSIVTGLETMPADTHAAQGAPPQTVQLSMASLNALPLQYNALTATAAEFTPTISPLSGGIVITSAATLTPIVQIVLPPSPIDGQQFRLSADHTVSNLLVTAGTATVSNTPTALTVSAVIAYGYDFRYRASNTTWYRIQ